SAAVDLGSSNINVNAVAPGFVKTELLTKLPREVLERAERESILGRVAEPEDIAHVVLFLCSEAARHITGQTIIVDGGLTLACGHPRAQNQTPASTAPLPTAGISGQQVGILPITLIAAEDSLHWDTVVGEREKADSVLTTLLKARAPEVGWVAPEELRRSARRAPGIATDPEQMATPLLRNPTMVEVLAPLRNQLRTLAAIAGGMRYVLAPAGLVYRRTVGLSDGRTEHHAATAELTV